MAFQTNFPIPNYDRSFTVPIFGSSIGKQIFVKPSSGNDEDDGLSPDSALKTLSQAHTNATANQNDVVYLISESNTGSTTADSQSSTLTWSTDLVTAPTKWSQRARITQATAADAISPLVNVTADSCLFSNLQVFHGSSSASSLVCVQVTGERNVFSNVHFAGIGNATQSASNAASLKVNGGSENYFTGCTIGLDTITRDADPSEILFDGNATRNYFEDCLINSFISAAGFPSVKLADTTAIDRTLIFKNCLFVTESTNKGTTQTEVFNIPAGISQGKIILQDTYAFSDGGAVDWDSNDRGIIWTNNVAAAASAAGGIMTNQ